MKFHNYFSIDSGRADQTGVTKPALSVNRWLIENIGNEPYWTFQNLPMIDDWRKTTTADAVFIRDGSRSRSDHLQEHTDITPTFIGANADAGATTTANKAAALVKLLSAMVKFLFDLYGF